MGNPGITLNILIMASQKPQKRTITVNTVQRRPKPKGILAPVAQGIERWSPEPKVTGSIPVGRANPTLLLYLPTKIF